MLRKTYPVLVVALVLIGLLPPSPATAARLDTKPPKITKAEMLDRNGNGLADAVRLTYNEKVKHRLDTDGRYPFKVLGPTKATSYRIKKVNAAKRSTRLLIILKEKQNGDATPDVKYVRTRKKPVRDLARNQAKRQIFIRTIGLPISADTHTLTVTPSENGTITSSPAGINCGTTCSADYPADSDVTLTATPDEGGEFGGWNGACSGTADTCVVTMDADKTVSAAFAGAGERTLTVQRTGAGKVTSDPSGIDCGTTCTKVFPQNDAVTLTAVPDANSRFLGWTGATGCADTTTCTVTMDASKTVEAEFTWVVTVIKTGTGSVSSLPDGMSCGADVTTPCAYGFAPGSTVILSASPSGGSKFVAWSDACTGTNAVAGCTLTMDANKSVKAAFGYDLTVTKDAAGTGTGTVTSSSTPTQTQQINCGTTCSATYPAGTQVTLTAAAGQDSVFEGWSGGGCSGTTVTCQVMVDAAKTVTAKFGLSTTQYLLTVTKAGMGFGAVSGPGIVCDGVAQLDCSESFTTGQQVALTAAALPGSTFSGWSGAGTEACGTNSICNVTMTEARNVTATFAIDDLGGGGGGGSTFAFSALASGASGLDSLVCTIGGSVDADCSATVAPLTPIVVTATEDPTNVGGAAPSLTGCPADPVTLANVTTCTFNMPSSVVSITANFS